MSRTLYTDPCDPLKKTYKHKSIRSGWTTSRKMKPYSGNKIEYKFGVDPGNGTGVSKTGKLVARNANRSLKKAARRLAKQEIQNFLDEDK